MSVVLEHEGIESPIRLRNGPWSGYRGTFWVWPVDGYFDLHHTEFGVRPDGSDAVYECFNTLEDVKKYLREVSLLWKWGIS